MSSPRKPSVLFVFYTHTAQSRRVADAMASVGFADGLGTGHTTPALYHPSRVRPASRGRATLRAGWRSCGAIRRPP